MISKEYKNAFAEVLGILKLCDKEVIEQIPLYVIQGLKNNANKVEDNFNEFHDDIEDIRLSQEAVALLAAIYRRYLCDDESRKAFDKKMLTAQELLDEAKISGDIFKSIAKKDNTFENVSANLPKEVKRENILSKIVNKIANLLKRR